MYSQTASLLESCAHNAARAEGPAAITQAISLLATRLAAVARLRAVFALRTEGTQQLQAFRTALERASGETYQRPSPTDSSTSTAISVPLDARQQASAGSPPVHAGGRRASSQPPGSRASAEPAAQPRTTPVVPLVGLPKSLLERQLVAAQHSKALLEALELFHRNSKHLREYMCRAAAQNSVHGLKVAAATLLLSADAGMGPASSILAFAKDALDAVMQMQ